MKNAVLKLWKKVSKAKDRSPVIYYISGDGNDTNHGKHPLRAWKSIEQLNKVKRQIKDNDQILYKRGFSYRGIPFYLDQTNYQKRIGAYGSGKYPVFPDIYPNKKLKNI